MLGNLKDESLIYTIFDFFFVSLIFLESINNAKDSPIICHSCWGNFTGVIERDQETHKIKTEASVHVYQWIF